MYVHVVCVQEKYKERYKVYAAENNKGGKAPSRISVKRYVTGCSRFFVHIIIFAISLPAYIMTER